MVNSTTHNRSQCKFANRIEYIYFSVLIVNRKSGKKKIHTTKTVNSVEFSYYTHMDVDTQHNIIPILAQSITIWQLGNVNE